MAVNVLKTISVRTKYIKIEFSGSDIFYPTFLSEGKKVGAFTVCAFL